METLERERPGVTPGLYGAVWRWHFYAGLFVLPFMVLLAITGGVYLFNTEIEEAWYAAQLRVEPVGPVLDLPAQEARIRAAYPGAKLSATQLPRRADLAAQWSLVTREGRALDVQLDPYRGTVQGEIDARWRLMNVVAALHGELMAGRVGDTLIELAASWGFVLVVTGLYLWWPRGAGLRGTLMPRLGARGRVFWRDLHAVPAAWNALLLVFLILSGLPWSGFWGTQLARLGTLSTLTQPTPNFSGTPPSPSVAPGETAAPGHAHDEPDEPDAEPDGAQALPWAVRHAPSPHSHAAGHGEPPGIAHIQQLIQRHDLRGPRLRVFYPRDARATWRISLVPARAQDQRTLFVDQYSGEVVQDTAWAQYSALGKAVEWGVMVHLGRQYGLANQLVGSFACVLIVLGAVTGAVMWWKRRPRGTLGAPTRPRSYRTTTTVALIALMLGTLFPLVGASLLVVLAVEGLLRWRVAR